MAAAIVAALSLQVARMTGDSLAHSLGGEHANALIERHDMLAGLLTAAAYPFAAAVLVAAWTLPATSPLPSGAGSRPARWPLAGLLARIGVPVLAIAVVVLTILTDHAGAVAVWNS
ncbi:hypothetical protein [Aestuariimicrobium ganziense]|uniref:hypothetical protein n=1 Tax=Aestuariimicrobium ganziense TaxID=2773677 RepID=UPI00194565EA|nr:hypothetical protein [Aestuariimicrobium ganziense]